MSEPTAPDPLTSARRERVLVVDDNEGNRALAQNVLEDEGYEVVLAVGGEQGVAAFQSSQPDCILLDARMPEVDGFAACARIRALPSGPETPIIFLTALRDVDTFDQAMAAGADDFLTRPVRPAELVVRVQTALKLRRMRTELSGHYQLIKHQRADLLRVQLQKERLTQFIVHDLKNPVHAIDLHAQVLLRDTSLGEDARVAAQHIREQARQLNRMIMNLLDVSKADEGKLVVEHAAVDVRALIASVLSELELAARAREVTLVSEVGAAQARGDGDLLRRLVANLVDNALRHAPLGSAVTISTSQLEGAVELRVRDTGTGVPDELKEAIFDAFVQVESGPSSRAGRGLGLSFCRTATIAHGGAIWVEDANPGACFCVRLPDGA